MSWLGLALAVAALGLLGCCFAYPYLKKPPYVERDFVGRVVDKSLTLQETHYGTAPLLRLLVETEDRKRFEVRVTNEQYERARVGMWVARTRGEIKLSWDKPGSPATGGDGDRLEPR